MGIYAYDIAGIGTVFGIAATAVALLGIAAAVVAYFSFSRQDQIQKRQAGWIVELTQRLDYVEPNLTKALDENKTLRELVSPVGLINANTDKVLAVLTQQDAHLRETLSRIEGRLTQ